MAQSRDTGNGEYYRNVLAKIEETGSAPAVSTTISGLFAWLREKIATASREERLAVYKKVRDEGVWPEEAGFYLVAWTIRIIAEEKIYFREDPHPELADINSRIEAVRKSHGLEEDEYWPTGEGPEEYQTLVKEQDSIADRITADTFRDCGENEMADLYLNNRERFEALFEAGSRYFHPSTPA